MWKMKIDTCHLVVCFVHLWIHMYVLLKHVYSHDEMQLHIHFNIHDDRNKVKLCVISDFHDPFCVWCVCLIIFTNYSAHIYICVCLCVCRKKGKKATSIEIEKNKNALNQINVWKNLKNVFGLCSQLPL